jgi:hypothetical protein
VVLAGASHPSARGFKSLALHKALNIASSVLLHLGRATDRAREGIPIAPVKAIKYTSSCGSLSSGEGSAPAILILEITTYQAWGQPEVRVWIRAQAP